MSDAPEFDVDDEINDDIAPIEVVVADKPKRQVKPKQVTAADIDPAIVAAITEQVKRQLMEQLGIKPESLVPETPMAAAEPDAPCWEFWATSPWHQPRIRRPGGGFIHFNRGYFRATNESDAHLIRTHLRGTVWEKNWPDGQPRPFDPQSGWSPGSWDAWMAYQNFTIARPHQGVMVR